MKILNKIEEYSIIFLMTALTLVMFANVVARVSDTNILWAKELTQHIFSWLIIIGSAYCVREGAHIGIDAFTKKFSDNTQIIFAKVAVIISVLFALILFIGGSIAFYHAFEIPIDLEDIPLPEWMFLSILPMGFGLLLFRCLQVMNDIFSGRKTSMGFVDEASEALESEKQDGEKS